MSRPLDETTGCCRQLACMVTCLLIYLLFMFLLIRWLLGQQARSSTPFCLWPVSPWCCSCGQDPPAQSLLFCPVLSLAALFSRSSSLRVSSGLRFLWQVTFSSGTHGPSISQHAYVFLAALVGLPSGTCSWSVDFVDFSKPGIMKQDAGVCAPRQVVAVVKTHCGISVHCLPPWRIRWHHLTSPLPVRHAMEQ